MTRFVGIDFSTTATGVAICDNGAWSVHTVSSKPAGSELADYYARVRGIAAGIRDLMLMGDVWAIEGISFGSKGASVDRLHYAWHRTTELLIDRMFAVPSVITPSQVKQLATGKGNAGKDEVLLATERRVPQAQVANNNEADAVWIAVGASVLAGSPVIDLPAAHVPKAWKEVK